MTNEDAVRVQTHHGFEEWPLLYSGKFWGINRASIDSPFFTVSHIHTGLALFSYVKIRGARKWVAVLDRIFPVETESEIGEIWKSLPRELKHAVRVFNGREA